MPRPPRYAELFVPLDLERPLQEQLLRHMRAAVVAGELSPGRKLPSTRALARHLRVSRTTTQLVYDQLQAEGFIVTRGGSGTFIAQIEPSPPRTSRVAPSHARPPLLSRHAARVAETRRRWGALATPAARQPVHFHPGVPDPRLFPRNAWARVLAECARREGRITSDYPDVVGARTLREVLAQHLATTRGVRCSASQIVIVTGMHQGLGLVARALADEGDVAVVEDPGYVGGAAVLAAEGMHVISAPVDRHGVDIRRLRAPAGRRVCMIHVTPSHQFPTGVVMAYPRRRTLLAWANAQRAIVFEEDYHAEFRFRGQPVESLYALDDSGTVVHGGTFAKSMSPALRIGYLVLPPALAEPIEHAKWLADFGSPALEQAALARFIERGDYARHLRRCRVAYWHRREALIGALERRLPQASWSGDDAGLHLLVRLADMTPKAEPRLLEAAVKAGVGIMSARIFHAAAPADVQLLLGYACLAEPEIEDGVRRLARAVRAASRR
jgi:GntR family transcriptional regulator / MocR family aminotransferase